MHYSGNTLKRKNTWRGCECCPSETAVPPEFVVTITDSTGEYQVEMEDGQDDPEDIFAV